MKPNKPWGSLALKEGFASYATFVLIWFCCGRPNERILFSFEFLAEIDKFRALVGVKNDEVSAVRLRDNSICV